MKFFLLFLLAISHPGLGQDAEMAIAEKIEADRQKQLDAAVKIDKSRQQIEAGAFNAAGELKKLGYDSFTAASMMDEKVIAIAKKVFQESHLEHVPLEKVRGMILEKSKGTKLHGFLLKSPKILDFFVDVMRDREALPALIGIFLKKKELKIYFYFWLGVLIFGFLIKKYLFPKKWKGFKRFSRSVLLSICCSALTFSVFYFMFKEEITPLGRVISRHIF